MLKTFLQFCLSQLSYAKANKMSSNSVFFTTFDLWPTFSAAASYLKILFPLKRQNAARKHDAHEQTKRKLKTQNFNKS